MSGKKLKPTNAPIAARIFNVLFCIFLFAVTMALVALLIARSIFSKENIKEMMKSTESEVFDSVEDVIKDSLSDVSGKKVKKLDDEVFEDLIAMGTSDMTTYILTGKGDPIDADAFADYLKENKKAIKKSTGIELDNSNIKDIKKQINKFNKDFPEEYEEMYESDFGTIIDITNFVFSDELLIGLIIAFGVLVLLIFAIFNKYIDKSFGYTGVTMLIVGILTLSVAIAETVLRSAVDDLLEDELDIGESAIDTFIGILQKGSYTYAAIGLVVGIGFIVIGCIIKKTRARLEAYKMAN